MSKLMDALGEARVPSCLRRLKRYVGDASAGKPEIGKVTVVQHVEIRQRGAVGPALGDAVGQSVAQADQAVLRWGPAWQAAVAQ